MAILRWQEPCRSYCDVAIWSLQCFLRNGYIRDPSTQKWARDDNGEILKTACKECNGLDPRPPELEKYYKERYATFCEAVDIIDERIKRRERMGKLTYDIDLRITDEELEQMHAELGDAEPTEENITATPTFQKIWARVYGQMKIIDEENKKAAAEEAANEV